MISNGRAGSSPAPGTIPNKESYYTYVISSIEFDELYKGSSGCLKTRLKNHNAGGAKSTKRYRPWKLVYYETLNTAAEARTKEKYFKTAAGRRYLAKKDLSSEVPFPK